MLRHLQKSLKRIDSDEDLFATTSSGFRGSTPDDILFATSQTPQRRQGGQRRNTQTRNGSNSSSISSQIKRLRCMHMNPVQKGILIACMVFVVIFMVFESDESPHEQRNPVLRRDIENYSRVSGDTIELTVTGESADVDDQDDDAEEELGDDDNPDEGIVQPLTHEDTPPKKLEVAVRGIQMGDMASEFEPISGSRPEPEFETEEEEEEEEEEDEDEEAEIEAEEQHASTVNHIGDITPPKGVGDHLNFHSHHPTAPRIGYMIPILSCQSSYTIIEDGSPPPSDDSTLYDAAAVLAHSIKKNSIHGSSGSKYAYHLIAVFHPDAVECHSENRTTLLQSLGYHTIVRDTPVSVSEIKNGYFRSNLEYNGQDNLVDYMKLYAYSLTAYPIVVLLDVKSLILQPLDELFNLFYASPYDLKSVFGGTVVPIARTNPVKEPTGLEVLYTQTYNSIQPKKWTAGINTSFLIIRPSEGKFNELKQIIKNGDYQPKTGWGGAGFGDFYGSMQLRGLLLYYHTHYHNPQSSLELDRCVYNNVGDIPYIRVEGKKYCRDTQLEFKENNCRDCREAPLNRVRSVNYSACREPWGCRHFGIRSGICEALHDVWHEMRAELRMEQGCVGKGHDSYTKLERPAFDELRGI